MKLMDEYEECVDYFCNNTDSPDSVDTFDKIAEMQDAIYALDTDEMSEKDLKYYYDVLERTDSQLKFTLGDLLLPALNNLG